MVGHRMSRLLSCVHFFALVSLLGCAGKILQHDNADKLLKVEEYEQKVKIKDADAAPATAATPEDTKANETPAEAVAPLGAKGKAEATKGKGKGKDKKKVAKTPVLAEKARVKPKGPRQPTIEDTEGFDGRRPLNDPFRIGEKATYNLSYFNVVAGQLEIAVKPFAEVNGQKAYHFEVSAKSNSFFSRIYAVEDKAVTYVSYDDLTPFNLQISIKESKQLAETRTLFDWKTNKANYWKKRITKESGEESKKLEWDIQPFSQNVVSVAYYLRTFKIEPGKKLAVRIADEGKNIVFTGEVLRRETLQTDIGPLKTVVIKPQLTVDGVFTPVGEILMWLTDDDRKFIVRMESKIKIGTIVAKIKALDKGQEPTP